MAQSELSGAQGTLGGYHMRCEVEEVHLGTCAYVLTHCTAGVHNSSDPFHSEWSKYLPLIHALAPASMIEYE